LLALVVVTVKLKKDLSKLWSSNSFHQGNLRSGTQEVGLKNRMRSGKGESSDRWHTKTKYYYWADCGSN